MGIDPVIHRARTDYLNILSDLSRWIAINYVCEFD